MKSSIIFQASHLLLYCIIPVFAAILILVLIRKIKGSRITANLVLSTIFQCAVAAILIFAISGISIKKEEDYIPSEAVVLVDFSYTAKNQHDVMDNFVYDILQEGVGQNCKIGVVLFGAKQKVALKMSEIATEAEAEEAYLNYLKACSETDPDGATDIASALKFVWSSASSKNNFVKDPSRTRIVILSDGLETDGDAFGAMKELTRNGAQIETSFYAAEYLSDACILNVEFPNETIYAGDNFDFTLTVKGTHKGTATIEIIDKDEEGGENKSTEKINLQPGVQQITLQHSCEKVGFHEFSFRLIVSGDGDVENNVFCSYIDVAEKNKILILETFQNESKVLESVLTEITQKSHLEIVIEDIKIAAEEMTANNLAEYSEVILYNSAVSDMTDAFQNELKYYVESLGGGLFTIGGFEKNEQGEIQMMPNAGNPEEDVPVMHSYQESDLADSVLAELIPIKFEKYDPAVAVVFVFDVSTSMMGTGAAYLSASSDAQYIMDNVLSTRDYIGMITLQDSYQAQDANLLPMTRKEYVREQIIGFESFWEWSASTQYSPALTQAVRMLSTAPQEVARKHIILFSDGGPGDPKDSYLSIMRDAAKQGITITVVTYYKSKKEVDGKTYYFNHSYDVVGWHINVDNMLELAEAGHGSVALLPRNTELHGVAPIFINDLKLDQLQHISYEKFSPERGAESAILENLTNLDLQTLVLNGYFPSKPKIGSNISVPLLANGAPLYADWEFGSGKVGSLLIDLEGVWSADLLQTEIGKTIIGNIVFALIKMVQPPPENSFEVTLSEDNFNTQVNVFNLKQDDIPNSKIIALVQAPDLSVTKFDIGELNRGGRFVFNNHQSGVYTVTILRVRSDYEFLNGNVSSVLDIPEDVILEMTIMHRAFSYSSEYDTLADAYTTGQDLLAAISTREAQNGVAYSKFIYDAGEVFCAYGTAVRINSLRQPLLISALVLYLFGIIFRLFKIKSFKHRKNQI